MSCIDDEGMGDNRYGPQMRKEADFTVCNKVCITLCGWVRNVEKLDNFIQNTDNQYGRRRCWKVGAIMSCGRTPCICSKAKLACDCSEVLAGSFVW